jgi:signal transduction histidine kinase
MTIALKPFAAWVIKYRAIIRGSLTAKTFLMLFSLFIAALSSVYFFTGLFLPFANERQASRDLFIRAENLVSELRLRNENDCGELFADFLRETGAELSLLDENRKPVSGFVFGNYSELSGQTREYPFRFADSNGEYILAAAYNPAAADKIKAAIVSSLPLIAVAVLLLSTTAALLFSRYTARPIKRISEIAGNIAKLDFSWYCPDIRGDEIGKLAASINELSDRLSSALKDAEYRERRRMLFFSAVSHELKTPVATVIGQLEGMRAGVGVYKDRDKYLERSAEILRGLDGFIREILSASYLDMQDGSSYNPVDISALTESGARKHSLTADIDTGVFVLGDADLLEKALGNIISNALAHSPEGAEIIVRLKRQGNRAELQVVNPGHIGKEHIPHLFEAFYRAGNSGCGSGLGLYLTRCILESHNATFKIENCKDTVVFEALFPIFTQSPH